MRHFFNRYLIYILWKGDIQVHSVIELTTIFVILCCQNKSSVKIRPKMLNISSVKFLFLLVTIPSVFTLDFGAGSHWFQSKCKCEYDGSAKSDKNSLNPYINSFIKCCLGEPLCKHEDQNPKLLRTVPQQVMAISDKLFCFADDAGILKKFDDRKKCVINSLVTCEVDDLQNYTINNTADGVISTYKCLVVMNETNARGHFCLMPDYDSFEAFGQDCKCHGNESFCECYEWNDYGGMRNVKIDTTAVFVKVIENKKEENVKDKGNETLTITLSCVGALVLLALLIFLAYRLKQHYRK